MPAPELLGYTRIPIVSSARSVYGKIQERGNLVLVVESSKEVAALRSNRPSGYLAPEASRQVLGRGYGVGVSERVEGVSAPAATFAESESLTEQRMRLAHRGIYSHPALTELPLNVPPRPLMATHAEREEYATLVIPAEVMSALRAYYSRRGAGRVTQAEEINAAAYAVFTAKLQSLPFGSRVTARPEVGTPNWVLEHLEAPEVPGRGVRGSALVPGTFPQTWTPSNIPGELPVTYETVAAVLFFVHGNLYLRRENFDNLMREQLGWHPCGTSGVFSAPYAGMRSPATNSYIWCPPPQAFPIAPPAAPQRRLMPEVAPAFPQHARPSQRFAPPPPKQRRF